MFICKFCGEAKWSQFPKHRKLIVLIETDLKKMKIL